MADYHVRLDPIGVNAAYGSYSSVLIAEIGERSLHWGNASDRGETSPIVTLKVGFLSITVDERVVGKPKLKALRDCFYKESAQAESRPRSTRCEDDIHGLAAAKRDAAEAALLAEDYQLACEIDPTVVFESIARAILDVYAAQLNADGVTKLFDKMLKHVANEKRYAFADGKRATKAELRAWLGVSDRALCSDSGNDNP